MARDPICGMDVSEKTAFTLSMNGERYFFCSSHCLKKFAASHSIPKQGLESCRSCRNTPLYRNKTLVIFAALVAIILLSYGVPILVPFRESLFMYGRTVWWAVLAGLLLGGVIDHFIPREYISHILAQPKKRTILYAVVLGFLMSACSHGILALSIELHKKGASNPAVVAFLLASPWANMALTVLLVGFFGIKAFFIILSAIIIALTTGYIFQFFQSRGIIEKNEKTVPVDDSFSIIADIKDRIRKRHITFETVGAAIRGVVEGSVSLADMVLWWILIGMGIAAAAAAYVPSGVFTTYLGPTVAGLFVTLAFATVIEVCSEGSAPVAFEIFRQTGALGNSFVFLMAGVVTDYTEIGLLWHNVGRKTAVMLPLVTVPQVVLLGIFANRFL